jgi:hypothetical protein
MSNYEKQFADLPENELWEYVNHPKNAVPEAVEAAIIELKKRGHNFSEEDLAKVNKEIKAVKEKANPESNITADPDAPEFYSQKIIYSFSFLFGTLFGSILMAMNFNRTKSQKGITEVLTFGVVFTIITICVINAIMQKNNSSPAFLFNLAGALLLKHVFWNKYIGAETKYRKRSYWVPMIIGIAMVVLLILLMISLRIIIIRL